MLSPTQIFIRVIFYFQAGDLVTPPKRTLFAQKMLEKKEGIYASCNNAPLGTV
jgi:hypothetical protein